MGKLGTIAISGWRPCCQSPVNLQLIYKITKQSGWIAHQMQKIVSCQLHCAGNCLICNRNFLQKRGFVFLPRLGKWQICLLHKFIWFFYACVLSNPNSTTQAVFSPLGDSICLLHLFVWSVCLFFHLFVCYISLVWFCACCICNLPIFPQFSYRVT